MQDTTPATSDLVTVARIRRLVADARLRPLRESAHIARAELAAALEVSPDTVDAWEAGAMPRREHALRLAAVLDELANVASV